MKTYPILFLALVSLYQSPSATAADAAKPVPAESATPMQSEKLAKAIEIARAWQNEVKSGKTNAAMNGWGYSAFTGTTPEALHQSLSGQTALLGPLLYSELEEDRCLVDLSGGTGPAKGIYITLRWLSQYENGYHRDNIILHEPEVGSQGLKIIGLRREPLPGGAQGGFELVAGLGQLALLKLHGAPRERWEPYLRESRALATGFKVELPAVPDSPVSDDKSSGERLVKFVMLDVGPLVEKLGPSGGAQEAKTALNAFALLMLYSPGEETCTRLAALMGSEAEKAKLPGELWKPVVKAVVEKQKLPVVHEAVQRMVAGISAHLQEKQTAEGLVSGAKEVLDAAFKNMASLPTYMARAEMTTPDGRKSTMDASLAPGIMDLTLQGFDGKRERRLVDEKGFFLSRDEGKNWQTDTDHETARGLCRTLQAPVDPVSRITEKQTFTLKGRDVIDGEELFRFESVEKAGESPRIYWILMSKAGPVVRRARLLMTFGDLTADTLLHYTKLGKEVDVAAPVRD